MGHPDTSLSIPQKGFDGKMYITVEMCLCVTNFVKGPLVGARKPAGPLGFFGQNWNLKSGLASQEIR